MNAAHTHFAPGKQVLVVDDEAPMRMALAANFERRGWKVDCAAGKREAISCFERGRHALVVSDVRMQDGNGFEVLRTVRELAPLTPVILLTAFAAVPDAVEAMRCGAFEYLAKPVVFEHLLEAAARVLLPTCVQGNEDEMIGSSPALLRTLEQARQVAASDVDVLIEAESGTGKELLARRIHRLSSRSERPFVAVNCAALPEALLESELFGHARGAFTGAFTTQPGKFQLANGGTLLLDEIGEMPLNLQPKLLRVLQEREFYPLGENRRVKLDLRVIAATNRPLAEMISAGSFRADLYYRLNVIGLTLPALRERREDIRALALHFAKSSSPPSHFSEEFLSRLEVHAWPGNVRELANTIQRALVLGEANAGLCASPKMAGAISGPCHELRPGMSLDAVERQLLAMTLNATAGNRSRAADMLGVSLRTVRNKIREYNLPARSDYAID